MTSISQLAVLFAVPPAIATIAYHAYEKRGRSAWMSVSLAPLDLGEGPYRRLRVSGGTMTGAPPLVRVTAAFGFLLGAAAVGYILCGVLVLGFDMPDLFWFPGGVVALGSWASSKQLLARAPHVARAACISGSAAIVLGVATIDQWAPPAPAYAALALAHALLVLATVQRHGRLSTAAPDVAMDRARALPIWLSRLLRRKREKAREDD